MYVFSAILISINIASLVLILHINLSSVIPIQITKVFCGKCTIIYQCVYCKAKFFNFQIKSRIKLIITADGGIVFIWRFNGQVLVLNYRGYVRRARSLCIRRFYLKVDSFSRAVKISGAADAYDIYRIYKMHNVLLNNSQPVIGLNTRQCVSLMDLCFRRKHTRSKAWFLSTLRTNSRRIVDRLESSKKKRSVIEKNKPVLTITNDMMTCDRQILH